MRLAAFVWEGLSNERTRFGVGLLNRFRLTNILCDRERSFLVLLDFAFYFKHNSELQTLQIRTLRFRNYFRTRLFSFDFQFRSSPSPFWLIVCASNYDWYWIANFRWHWKQAGERVCPQWTESSSYRASFLSRMSLRSEKSLVLSRREISVGKFHHP